MTLAASVLEYTGVRYALSDIESKYAEQTDVLFVHEKKDKISISNIVVKKELRNSGIGQAILTDIINYADENGKTITLTPTSEFGTKELCLGIHLKLGIICDKLCPLSSRQAADCAAVVAFGRREKR